MEDLREEWEIQEYYSSDGSDGRLRWILDRGLNLGKKIVITSVVISSAPLILPPLVVISALGFALSIPFGLVFVSYACTEKLMSKLLPGPKSPLMLGYGILSTGKIEEEEFGFGGDIMEEEEKGQMEDMKGWDEYWRICDEVNDQGIVEEMHDEIGKDWECEEDVGEHLESKADMYGQESTGKDDEEPRNDVDEIVKEEGYEKDVGEDFEGKDKAPSEGIDVKIKGIREEEKQEPLVERSKSEQPVVDVHQVEVVAGKDAKIGNVITGGVVGGVVERGRADKVNTPNKEEDLARETTGFLQELRDEGDASDPVGKDKKQRKDASEIAKDMDQKNFALAAEMEKPSEVKSVKLEKLIGKMKGGKKRNKGLKQDREIQERRTEQSLDVVPGVVEQVVETGVEVNRDEKNPEKVVVVEEPIVNTSKPLNGNRFVKVADRTGAGYSYTTGETHEAYQKSPARTQEEKAGSFKRRVSAEVPEAKHGGIHTAVPASKVPPSEKKIWEHIEALRKIVGYKAAPRATCVEEIKALYIFTGVELPVASFKNTSDLVEVNDRVQFLMSIVGVK